MTKLGRLVQQVGGLSLGSKGGGDRNLGTCCTLARTANISGGGVW